MSVLKSLATALDRRDEVPNKALAQEIVRANDKHAVKELVENLNHKDRDIQSDCIKVLYEIGQSVPALIAPYCREFAKLLDNKNNRLVWGAMCALDAIAMAAPKDVYKVLAKIVAVADSGSVITRDHAVSILVKLGALKQYAAECVPLLIEQLQTCPNNQFPSYAEKSLKLVDEMNRPTLQKVLTRRLESLETASQQKRVAKVLRRLAKKS